MLKSVLAAAEFGENGIVAGTFHAESIDYFGIVGVEERIETLFDSNCGRDGRSSKADLGKSFGQFGIVRGDGVGEFVIFDSVIVAAVEEGTVGEFGKVHQGFSHSSGVCFENTATTVYEKCVACEKHSLLLGQLD